MTEFVSSPLVVSAQIMYSRRYGFGFFAGLGWHPREIRYLAEEADKLNRPPAFPVTVRFVTRVMGLFMSRERREAMKRYTEYVLFEPS